MNITILTGAGISAESGISTFRDSNGLWENHDIADVASLDGFRKDPELVHAFYNERRRNISLSEPNSAHFALAAFQDSWSGAVSIITQNVDGLHERAGSTVIPMHGALNRYVCMMGCSERFVPFDTEWDSKTSCHYCSHLFRPDVVWFGEPIRYSNHIDTILQDTDIFVSLGTSGTVYPANTFRSRVNVWVNIMETDNPRYQKSFIGKATETVPEMINWLHDFC